MLFICVQCILTYMFYVLYIVLRLLYLINNSFSLLYAHVAPIRIVTEQSHLIGFDTFFSPSTPISAAHKTGVAIRIFRYKVFWGFECKCTMFVQRYNVARLCPHKSINAFCAASSDSPQPAKSRDYYWVVWF